MTLDNLLQIRHETLHVEIEVNSFCNASCIHCPRDNMPPHEMMDEITFENILSKYVEYRKKISLNLVTGKEFWPKFIFSGGGEPILNPRTPKFIEESKKQGFHTKIYSNAIKLDEENIEALVSSGIDEISVSFLGINEKEFFRAFQNRNYEKALSNVLVLRDIVKGSGTKFRVTYNALDTLESTDEEIHAFWEEKGIECGGPYVVWNRGDQITQFEHKRVALDKNKAINFAQEVWCLRLQHYDSIRANGDFTYCCCGYFNKDVPILGSINQDSLEKMHNAYEEILKRKSNNTMCRSCIKPSETYLVNEVIQFLEQESGYRF